MSTLRIKAVVFSTPISLISFGAVACVCWFASDLKKFQEGLGLVILLAGCLLLALRTLVETQRWINHCAGQQAIGSDSRTFWGIGVGLLMGAVLMAAFWLRRVFEHAELMPAFCFLVINGAFAVVVRLRRSTAPHEFHSAVIEAACLFSAIGYLIAKYAFHLVNGEFGLGLSFNTVFVQTFLFVFDECFASTWDIPCVSATLATNTTSVPKKSTRRRATKKR